jgi:ankyrin repeat protein
LKHSDIDINKQYNIGWTPLIYASKNSNIDSTEETIKILLKYPDIDINLQNNDGF